MPPMRSSLSRAVLQMWLLVIGTVLMFAVAILTIAWIFYITDPSKVPTQNKLLLPTRH